MQLDHASHHEINDITNNYLPIIICSNQKYLLNQSSHHQYPHQRNLDFLDMGTGQQQLQFAVESDRKPQRLNFNIFIPFTLQDDCYQITILPLTSCVVSGVLSKLFLSQW